MPGSVDDGVGEVAGEEVGVPLQPQVVRPPEPGDLYIYGDIEQGKKIKFRYTKERKEGRNINN